MTHKISKYGGGRRIARPETVQKCPHCQHALGFSYRTCSTCFMAIEQFWLADWQALLAQEQVAAGTAEEKILAGVVLQEVGEHAWTIMDIAMSLQTCGSCAAVLGDAYPVCAECAEYFGYAIYSEFGITGNEHALHIGRSVLRSAVYHSDNIVFAWSHNMPRLLTGWLPTTAEAQRAMALVKSGRLAEMLENLQKIDAEIEQNYNQNLPKKAGQK